MSERRNHPPIGPDCFDAVLFDLDGVPTDTTRIHVDCWKEMFAGFLRERAQRNGDSFQPFDIADDHRLYVDGKQRTGGAYGVDERIRIACSRAVIRGALTGSLRAVPTRTDPVFGFEVPQSCPDVPAEVLQPRATWTDRAAYDAQARKLAGLFVENFEAYAEKAAPEVLDAAPRP